MNVNDPVVHRELSQLYPLYEAALMANDADTLTRMFWASPHAMRRQSRAAGCGWSAPPPPRCRRK